VVVRDGKVVRPEGLPRAVNFIPSRARMEIDVRDIDGARAMQCSRGSA
jgi:hypothetical protein